MGLRGNGGRMVRQDCPGFPDRKAYRGCRALPGRQASAGRRGRKAYRVFPDNRVTLALKEHQGCKGHQAHRAFKGRLVRKDPKVRRARLDPSLYPE